MSEFNGCLYLKGEGHFVPSDTQHYNDRVFGRFPDGTYGFVQRVDGQWARLPRIPLT